MNTMATTVPTANGGKYVRQLCKHWSHKLPVDLSGDTGVVSFVGAQATMEAGESGLTLTVSGADRETVERLSDVVARHIDRFAFREAPLAYDWSWQ